MSETVTIRALGVQPYETAWAWMRAFTDRRRSDTPDELWWLEHPPVFTLGQAGRPEHVLDAGSIPVVHSDRGGQVTYHGPGQLVVYLLVDLRRRGQGPRYLVDVIEQTLVALLAGYGVSAAARPDAPGVYVDGAKIAQLGLRVRRGCSYHGLSLNVAMDLSPFDRINPCGHAGLPVTDLRACVPAPPDRETLVRALMDELSARLGYTGRTLTHAKPMAD